MHVHGNAAAIVLYRHRLIVVNGNADFVAVSAQGFVDGIVNDFEDHLVQTRSVIGVADVHAGAFLNRLETFEDGNVFCRVITCWLSRCHCCSY